MRRLVFLTLFAHISFSIAVICTAPLCGAQELPPRTEVFGGYSVNADYVKDRSVLIIVDQKVSPFFSHGSGPFGFELSFKRYVRGSLGVKIDFSSYSDTFRGLATYCQPTGCGTGLTFESSNRAFYLTTGPEWKFRRDKKVAPFVQALVGIEHARSAFTMAGSDVQYVDPFRGAGLIVFNHAGFPKNSSVTYSDSIAEIGPALSFGGGFDTRLSRRLSLRVLMDYDPSFLVRPEISDPTLVQTTPSARYRQGHIRLSLGLIIGLR